MQTAVVKDEGVELTVFAARIDSRRQASKQALIVETSRETAVEELSTDAAEDSPEAQIEELPRLLVLLHQCATISLTLCPIPEQSPSEGENAVE